MHNSMDIKLKNKTFRKRSQLKPNHCHTLITVKPFATCHAFMLNTVTNFLDSAFVTPQTLLTTTLMHIKTFFTIFRNNASTVTQE